MINKLNEIEIGVIGGCAGSGKTKELINIATGYLVRDKKVLHITYEMNKNSVINRYERQLEECMVGNIEENLIVKQIKNHTLNSFALTCLLEKHKPDIVLIDCEFESQSVRRPFYDLTVLLGEVTDLCVSFKTSLFMTIQTNRTTSGYVPLNIKKQFVSVGEEYYEHNYSW
jgi:hypothetical protein